MRVWRRSRSNGSLGDELYLGVPHDSEFATVQVTFKDGTVSPKQKVVRTR